MTTGTASDCGLPCSVTAHPCSQSYLHPAWRVKPGTASSCDLSLLYCAYVLLIITCAVAHDVLWNLFRAIYMLSDCYGDLTRTEHVCSWSCCIAASCSTETAWSLLLISCCLAHTVFLCGYYIAIITRQDNSVCSREGDHSGGTRFCAIESYLLFPCVCAVILVVWRHSSFYRATVYAAVKGIILRASDSALVNLTSCLLAYMLLFWLYMCTGQQCMQQSKRSFWVHLILR